MGETQDVETGPNAKLLALFGLTVEQAGARVGRTRASIRAGFSEGRKRPVLNLEDVVQLRLLEHLWERHTCDEQAVIEELRVRYGEKAATRVRNVFERMALPCQLDSYDELWMLIPDIQRTIEENEVGYLRDLLQFPGKVTFYTGSPLGDEVLQAFIGTKAISAKGGLLTFKWDTPVESSPTMLIANPHTTADVYLRGRTKFFNAPVAGSGVALVTLLKHLEGMTPLQRLLTE